MTQRLLVLLLVALSPTVLRAADEPGRDWQAVSWLGDTLRDAPQSELDRLRGRSAALKKARRAYDRDSTSADALLDVGKALSGTGQYREAVDTFSQGMEEFPGDPRFPRRRGHRWITLRELDSGIQDLLLAEEIALERVTARDTTDRTLVTDRLRFDIHYTLGLAFYLQGDLRSAESRYRLALTWANTPDLDLATRYWLALTLCRARRTHEIEALLVDIKEDRTYRSARAFLGPVMLFAGRVGEGDVLPGVHEKDPAGTVVLHGVAQWRACRGNEAGAREMFERVLSGGQWASTAYLGAEAALASRRKAEGR